MTSSEPSEAVVWDVIVVGAGTVGIPTAITAADRGAKVLLIEASDRIGGSLHLAMGSFSAAGTKIQQDLGIADSPQLHFEDSLRISAGTGNRDLLRLWQDNAAETLDWLMAQGLKLRGGRPRTGGPHEPYMIERNVSAEGFGAGFVDALEPALQRCIANGGVTLRLGTRMTGLRWAGSHDVDGVDVATSDGATHAFRAKAVVLATGGYAANEQMWSRFHANPHRVHANSFSQGDGLSALTDAGVSLAGADTYVPSFGGVKDPDTGAYGFQSRILSQFRLPWEIYVTMKGKRFLAEDEISPDKRERILMQQEDESFWCLYDEAIRRDAPPLLMWDDAQLAQAFAGHPDYRRADSLADLARLCGLDPAVLTATVADYNAGQARGADAFGRTHMPRPLAEPPFYAVRHYAVSVLGFAGAEVDTRLRVVGRERRPIANLFAAGEMLGMGVFGRAYLGGAMISAGLTFGRLLGTRFLAW